MNSEEIPTHGVITTQNSARLLLPSRTSFEAILPSVESERCLVDVGSTEVHIWLVVSNIFDFHPYLGKISNLTNIFQMG